MNNKQSNHEPKTLCIEVLFFTDGIAEQKGEIVPKHTLDSGVVRALVGRNSRHGIVNKNPIPFNGMHDIPRAVRKCLIQHEVVQHIKH